MISPVVVAGLPGSGKTTLIRRLAEKWGHSNCVGFFTQERRERGARTGFFWETFDGKRGILADLSLGQPRVGKYHVDLQSFEPMLAGLVTLSDNILLIDEVGKMECLSEEFRKRLPEWEHADCHRIFTVASYGTPIIEAFKTRNRSHLITLTPRNRDEVFQQLASTFFKGEENANID